MSRVGVGRPRICCLARGGDPGRRKGWGTDSWIFGRNEERVVRKEGRCASIRRTSPFSLFRCFDRVGRPAGIPPFHASNTRTAPSRLCLPRRTSGWHPVISGRRGGRGRRGRSLLFRAELLSSGVRQASRPCLQVSRWANIAPFSSGEASPPNEAPILQVREPQSLFVPDQSCHSSSSPEPVDVGTLKELKEAALEFSSPTAYQTGNIPYSIFSNSAAASCL